jgi:GNAT superfamily N-acetyltransferase
MREVTVRSACLEDADQLARLFDQLGYPQTDGTLRAAIRSVLGDPRADLLVADKGGALLGVTTYFLVQAAHDSHPWCHITALIVDEAHRGQGIGELLVEAAEQAAHNASCSRIEATSALHRTAAHRFYEKLGYGHTSTHFLKRL